MGAHARCTMRSCHSVRIPLIDIHYTHTHTHTHARAHTHTHTNTYHAKNADRLQRADRLQGAAVCLSTTCRPPRARWPCSMAGPSPPTSCYCIRPPSPDLRDICVMTPYYMLCYIVIFYIIRDICVMTQYNILYYIIIFYIIRDICVMTQYNILCYIIIFYIIRDICVMTRNAF